MSGKQGRMYGLILKKRPGASLVFAKPSIFQDDSSSDEDEKGRKAVNETIGKEAEKRKQMRQTQIERDKVLDDDPTAYDYDKVYEEMAEKKASLVAAKSTASEKKPKYIGNLLKFAEVRKKEDERRTERQVQKEREEEGSEFVDKDAFVTSAYRKKMQEMAEDEERQRKLDELEGDVTKQSDLSKFYRNLLDKNVSTGGAYDSEEPSSCVKDADAREIRHDETSAGGETLEKSDRQLNKEELRKRDGSFQANPSHEGQPEKTRDGEKRREKIRDSEERRGKTRDSERRREKIRDSEERREKTRDSVGRREKFKDSEERRGETRDSDGRREKIRDSEERRGKTRDSEERREKFRDSVERRGETRDSDGRREKITDSVERRGETRDSEERRGKTRDSEERREKNRESEGRQAKIRDNEGQRETTKDDRPKLAKCDKWRRGSTRDKEEQEEVSRDDGGQYSEQEIMKDDARDHEKETSENIQTLDSEAMNDESKGKEREKSGVSKFAKHSSSETVISARERYLARKNVRVVMTQPTSEDEDQ